MYLILERCHNKMIYTVIFIVIISLLDTLSAITKLLIKTNNLKMTNIFCKRISKAEYNFQMNNHTKSALKNL